MPTTFENFIKCLRAQFDRLDALEIANRDLIIGYGTTGAGKSTLFMSLIFGKNALAEQ